MCLAAAFVFLSDLPRLIPPLPPGGAEAPLPVRNLFVSLILVGGVGAAVLFVVGRAGLALGRWLYGVPDASEHDVATARRLLVAGLTVVGLFWAISRASGRLPTSMQGLVLRGIWPVAVTLALIACRRLGAMICVWGRETDEESVPGFTAVLWPWLVALGFFLLLRYLPTAVSKRVLEASRDLSAELTYSYPASPRLWSVPLIGVAAGLALMVVPGHLARFLSGRWLSFFTSAHAEE